MLYVYLPAMPCQRCVHLGYEQAVVAGAKTLLPASASPAKQGLIKTCDWDKTSEASEQDEWGDMR